MARPLKLNAKLREKVCDLLRKGKSIGNIRRALGIAETTWKRWMDLGSKPESKAIYRRFRSEVDAAKEAPLDDIEECVMRGAKEDPKFGLSILARRRPEVWERQQKVTVEGNVGVSVADLMSEHFAHERNV